MFAFATKFSDENSITHANGYRFRLLRRLQAEALDPKRNFAAGLHGKLQIEQPMSKTLTQVALPCR